MESRVVHSPEWIEAPHERLRVVGVLARGGMAEILIVERARGSFRKQYALKRTLLAGQDDVDISGVNLLMRDEGRLGLLMSHANVVDVCDAWPTPAGYYLLLERLHGVTFTAVIRSNAGGSGPVDPRLAAGLFVQVCAGLHYAHELADHRGRPLGIVHRDVTPGNLFATFCGVAKVLDFGVAHSELRRTVTNPGSRKGKYAYMAPEYLDGEPVDRRADVFASTAVLYEMLAGRRLFRRDSHYETMRAVLYEPVPPLACVRPGLPPALCDLVARGLARDPSRRISSMAELAAGLVRAVAPLGGPMSIEKLRGAIANVAADSVRTAQHTVVEHQVLAPPVPLTDQRPRVGLPGRRGG